jgi:hypothetical protein
VIFCQLEQESSPANADCSQQPSTREMIILMHFQWLNFTSWLLTVYNSYNSFCRHYCHLQKKWPQNIYWAELALLDNKNTLEMDHFWCTYDDWTLSLVTGQVWTVTKIDKGILLFVKNDNLRNTWCWMHLPFPTPNNKVTWKMDHFSCTFDELLLCLFKIIFEE